MYGHERQVMAQQQSYELAKQREMMYALANQGSRLAGMVQGVGGLAAFGSQTAQSQLMTFREELQQETDEWLEGVLG